MPDPSLAAANAAAGLSASLESAPQNAAVRSAALLSWVLSQADEMIHAVGIENFIVMVNAAYDKYIAPIDVPWVPDVAEPVVIDAPAKWFIGQVIRGIHDRIHPVTPTT